MAFKICTENVVFGLVDPKPLKRRISAGRSGFPKGRARIRLRNKSFAAVFIKTSDGIRQYAIKEVDGFWEPFVEQASNRRIS